MTDLKSNLSDRIVRLFYAAGLLTQNDVEGWRRRHSPHKSILGVLGQDVSLNTFKDLLMADIMPPITQRGRRGRNGEHNGGRLHEGLTSTGLINDRELDRFIERHNPDLGALARRIKDDGVDLEGEDAISAQTFGHWLTRIESKTMRQSALWIALLLMVHNRLLNAEEQADARDLIDDGRLDELHARFVPKHNLTPQRLLKWIEADATVPQTRIESVEIAPELFDLFPQSMIRRLMFVPFQRDGDTISLAVSDPFDISFVALTHALTGLWVRPYFAPGRLIIDKINQRYHEERLQGEPTATTPTPAKKGAPLPAESRLGAEIVTDDVSAVQLVSSIIESAIDLRATDIHIEPTRKTLTVRFRIDGELHPIMKVPANLAQPVVSRVKVLADMDVTERRRPQDGHFELPVGEHGYDFRISSLPTIHGEKVVIRILDTARIKTGLNEIGLTDEQLEALEWMIARPYGMLLVTGPTGSGKTSTLYAALHQLNHENRNLVTIEDPVEYQLPGIVQVQVAPEVDLTFAAGLRSILRQDPDTIMVGEIRDPDTTNIAIRAAMTGHLVLSTLHTNSGLGAVDALIHLGAVPFMVAGSLVGVVNQRLVRTLCESCRKPRRMTAAIARQLGLPANSRKRIYDAAGCDECLGSGYFGRTGVFETVRMDEELRGIITEEPRERREHLDRVVRERGTARLQDAGVQKILDGVTSLEEVTQKIILDLE